MILETSLKLEAVLAGAVAANQPEVHVHFIDYNPYNEVTRPSLTRSALNGVTVVIILAAPVANPAREVVSLAIYNKDTASVTVTVQTNDGTTVRIIVKQVLLTTETLIYEKSGGWQIL